MCSVVSNVAKKTELLAQKAKPASTGSTVVIRIFMSRSYRQQKTLDAVRRYKIGNIKIRNSLPSVGAESSLLPLTTHNKIGDGLYEQDRNAGCWYISGILLF